MKLIIKKLLLPIRNIFFNKSLRSLIFLYIKFSDKKRFKKINNIKCLNFDIDIVDAASFLGQFREIFVDQSYKFISNNESPVIFDCGANIGISCLYFKSIYPKSKITAFEADGVITQTLKSNLERNNIFDVNIIEAAVWVNNSGIQFSVEGADGGSIQGSSNMQKVRSIRLKDYIDNCATIIDLLKIDIEGAEGDVILDCNQSLKKVNNIFIEYHSWNHSNQYLSNILKILEDNNFRYYIEGTCGREQAFCNTAKDKNMDLQLNIFARNLR
jgi:FkbM family methyltransferase